MTYFFVPEDKYFKAYNDYEFIFNYTTDYNNLQYLSWSAARVLLKKYFPSYEPVLEVDENGSKLFPLTNALVNKELLAKDLEQLVSKLEETKDYKEKKKLLTSIEEHKNQLLYDNRGFIIKPYLLDLETNLRTVALDYPLMDNSNNAIYNPESRDLNDNIQRAYVKAIAVHCGIGLRLYSREGIGKDLEASSIVKVIKAIVERSEILGIEVDRTVVNFGSSLTKLMSISKPLKEQVDKLAK